MAFRTFNAITCLIPTMNILNFTAQYSCRVVAMLFALCLSSSVHADLFGDEDVLWKSGLNLYIKFNKQDRSDSGKTVPNQHPVDLDTQQITSALKMAEYWSKKSFFSREQQANTVFSTSQAQVLGNYLAQGLKRAKSDQDIVFALSVIKSGGMLKEKFYMAGRAFYLDNRLNIILGDYDRPPDKGLEAASGATGQTEVQYLFAVGRRASASGSFKHTIVTGGGIDIKILGKKGRKDWLVIDVPTAATAYTARMDQGKSKGADSEAMRAEAAKLEKERREMRAEMARMRKEMAEAQGNTSEQSSVEDRLARLEELHSKKLITDEEYEKKRQEIMDDI